MKFKTISEAFKFLLSRFTGEDKEALEYIRQEITEIIYYYQKLEKTITETIDIIENPQFYDKNDEEEI